MKKTSLLVIFMVIISLNLKAQNVGIGTTTPNASAQLDIQSSSKGLLIPRLTTTQRTAISTPAEGLMVYDTDLHAFYFYNGTQWKNVSLNNSKSIYIPANALSYIGTGVTQSQYGLTLANNATARPGFVIPKPVDWDETKPFSVTIIYSVPGPLSTNTIVSWRIYAGSNEVNSTSSNANSGWDSYSYEQSLDAPASSIPSTTHTNVAKSQTWTADYSSTYGTWYLGGGVSTNNSFSGAPLWHFNFQRGNAAGNGEGYTGPLTINGISLNYTAK